jgi:hypothetical protein
MLQIPLTLGLTQVQGISVPARESAATSLTAVLDTGLIAR